MENCVLSKPEAPTCPSCGEPCEEIYSSQLVVLRFHDGEWHREIVDKYETFSCGNCYEELSVDELTQMGVPNEVR